MPGNVLDRPLSAVYSQWVHVRSLAYRTDLALLRRGGSVIEDRGDHLVVRSPHQPRFWWGNFLLLAQEPPPREAARWLSAFRDTFPEAAYIAIGVDTLSGASLSTFAAAGLTRHDNAVLSAATVRQPAHSATAAVCRPLQSDQDWAQGVDLRMAVYPPDESSEQPDAYRRFVTDGFVVSRALVEDGDAVWMGGFIGDRLEAQMGLVDAGDGLGRFQAVETRPAARGQGLCGTLTYATARYGLEAMGAQELVIVADPAYVAIRIYESLGFSRVETQTAWETAGRG